MSNLWIVVPAAGESQRFKDAGYDIPKPFLRIEDKLGNIHYMIEYCLISSQFLHTPVTEDPRVGVPAYFAPPNIGLGYRPIVKTSGQADTVYQLLENLPEDDSVLVLDCDMILRSDDLQRMIELVKVYDAVIAVTKTFDPNASRVDQIPNPTRFVEKEPISEYGIVGARAFKNIGKLQQALKRTIERYKTIGQEPYLSVAINHYPGTKFAYLISEYTDWGTPERITASGARIVS